MATKEEVILRDVLCIDATKFLFSSAVPLERLWILLLIVTNANFGNSDLISLSDSLLVFYVHELTRVGWGTS